MKYRLGPIDARSLPPVVRREGYFTAYGYSSLETIFTS